MILERLFMNRVSKEVKKYFDEIASQWDSMSKEFYSVSVREKILDLIHTQNPTAAKCSGQHFIVSRKRSSVRNGRTCCLLAATRFEDNNGLG